MTYSGGGVFSVPSGAEGLWLMPAADATAFQPARTERIPSFVIAVAETIEVPGWRWLSKRRMDGTPVSVG